MWLDNGMNTTSRQIIENRSDYITDSKDIAWYLGELDITEYEFDTAYAELVEHFGFAR
jgi:hypothetical protein